ncbi:FAD binding domain-containing protein [Phakopsora pachyrhizi]|nr:FAD binding domain-containing protein [Phakopsora pachyrhizi]
MASKVIVVGGGLSGLSAAHTLYDRGANLLVLDKNPFFGGNSTKATSGINGAGTNSQSALGIPDSAKSFFDDTKRSARELARDDLIKVLTGKSAEAVNWLQDKFGLDLSKVSRLGGHTYERTHRGGAQFPGMTITYALMEALEDLAENDPNRVQIIKKAKVTKLLRDSSGAVTGVEYEFDGKKFTENGPVILATGGYAADFSPDGLLAKYRPELLKLPTTNGDHCTGDGQKMTLEIGGAGIDLEKVQVHPTGLVDPNEPDAKVKFLAAEALRGVGGILLNNEGDRFVDELGHRDYVTGKMWENNKFPIRLVLNKDSSEEILWHCKHYVGRGLMKKFDTGAELAKEIGIPVSKLKSTFDEYVQIGSGKKPDPYKKKFFHNYNFTLDGPFFVASMTPVLHYSMGGVEINNNSEVLDTNKKPIPGLYASGEVAGGVHGVNRLGGSSLLGCVVFGRVAADSASSYLLRSLATGSGPAARLGQIQNHLKTIVEVNPQNKNVQLTFSWDDSTGGTQALGQNGGTGSAAAQTAPPQQTPNQAGPNGPGAGGSPPKASELKAYTLEEVAKHKSKDDVWVVVNGEVLDVTKFKAYKYAPESIIGTLKQ